MRRPHGPLLKLADNLWRVEAPVPYLELDRAMTVARLHDGRLVIHSAIALTQPVLAELEALGPPAYLVVPSGYHRIDAPAYKKRYPGLVVLTPRGARERVARRVAVDGTYDDFPPTDTVRLERLEGVGDTEGVMVVRSRDGVTLVFNDIVFNMDHRRNPLHRAMTTLSGSAPGPRVSRIAKMLLVKDRVALKQGLLRLAGTAGLVRAIPAHEKIASAAEAAQMLRSAAAFL